MDLNAHPDKVYEDTPLEVRREWLKLVGEDVLVTIPVKVEHVGSKGILFSTKNVLGEKQTFSVPTEEVAFVG